VTNIRKHTSAFVHSSAVGKKLSYYYRHRPPTSLSVHTLPLVKSLYLLTGYVCVKHTLLSAI